MNEIETNKGNEIETFTLQKINDSIKHRLEAINEEFRAGMNAVTKYDRSVTFFGSARTTENETDYINAKELGRRVSQELGYVVTTGGAGGIMAAANRGAFESNGKSLGLTIRLPKEQTTNHFINEQVDFKYFFIRKVCLSYSAEAYLYFPGGFGTMDELFEILTLVQTKKIPAVPIILFGKEFWTKFDGFIKNVLLAENKIGQDDSNLYTITDSIDEAIEIIKKAPIRTALY